MLRINAESEDSPLRSKSSNKSPARIVLSSKRLYPERKFGNNCESPEFFKIDKIFDNKQTASKIHNDFYRNNRNISKNINDYSPNFYNEKQNKYDRYEKEDLLNKLNHCYPRKRRIIKNYLNISYEASAENRNNMNSDINVNLSNVNNFHNYNNISQDRIPSKKRKSIKLELPEINSHLLKNINEYNIKENGKVNENRVLNAVTKPIKDYNIISHRKMDFSPNDIKIDKWPLYYEKYYSMLNQNKAFHRKKNVFVEQINNKRVMFQRELEKEVRGDESRSRSNSNNGDNYSSMNGNCSSKATIHSIKSGKYENNNVNKNYDYDFASRRLIKYNNTIDDDIFSNPNPIRTTHRNYIKNINNGNNETINSQKKFSIPRTNRYTRAIF